MSNDSIAYLQKLEFLLKTSSESTTKTQEFLGKSSYIERQKAFERVSNIISMGIADKYDELVCHD